MTELSEAVSRAPDPPLILLVDDNADTRDLFALFFADSGFKVEQASNGAEALTKLRTATSRPIIAAMTARCSHSSGST